MAEVSDLKIKLVGMEKEQSEYEEKQNKAEVSCFLLSFSLFFCRVSGHTPELLSWKEHAIRPPVLRALSVLLVL